ncbi:MAG: cytochrome c peroxidase [Planctomycetota bacterium]|nr:cytochrome c peroxidase [Planctomycetota bacterium]
MRAIIPCCLLAVSSIAQTNFPPPAAPVGNPVTQNKALLGMALFFEEQLSSSSTVACATCHDFTHGGADPRTAESVHPGQDASYGTGDDIHGAAGVPYMFRSFGEVQLFGHPVFGFGPQVTRRRSSTVINTGYHSALGYDGRTSSLEAFVMGPILHPAEMGRVGRTWAEVETEISAATPLRLASDLPPRLEAFLGNRTYPDLFQLAFGSPQISGANIARALASYLRTLNSDQSKWDQFQNGNPGILTPQEQHGLQLFTNPIAGATSCSTCHGDFHARVQNEGPGVGQLTTTTVGYYGSSITTRLLFHNIGIRPISEDPGRQNETGLPSDAGKFRVASLRNVELTGPYFHNGSAETLRDVIDFYDRGGDFHANQAPSLTPRGYTAAEKDALVAILETLTDPRLLTGEAPFDRPLLGSQSGKLPLSFGKGMRTNAGTLTARAPFAPVLGNQRFSVTLSGVSAGTMTVLMWDATRRQTSGPANLLLALSDSFQAFGTGPASWLMSMPSTGVVRQQLPLPNVPSLRGVTLYCQWLAFEPAEGLPIGTSNGLQLQLQ